MKIAFYKAFQSRATRLDVGIAVGTLGTYSHVEIIFDDGESFSISPRDGGSRFKTIEFSPEVWDIFELKTYPGCEKTVKAIIEQHFLGKEYDYMGAFMSAFPFCYEQEDKLFCSEAVVNIFRRFPDYSFFEMGCGYSPNRLYKELMKNHMLLIKN